MGNLPGWIMVDATTGQTVEPDTMSADFRGEEHLLIGVSRAPEGNSSGRVTFRRRGEQGGTEECFPSVFNVIIAPDVVVPDTAEAAEQRPPFLEKLLDSVAEELTKAGVTDGQSFGIGVSVRPHAAACETCLNDPVVKAVRTAMRRAADTLQPVFADIFGQLASDAYWAGLEDGKAGKELPDRLHCAIDDTESGD